ncbi:MAG: hypothetical protein WD138_03625, partial [Halofilum sp. (in: g-proteobacteria)]
MGGQRKGFTLLAGWVFLVSAAGHAATVIETDGTGRASVLYISDTKVRVENAASAGNVTLFDRAADEMVFIDHGAQRFQRIDREEMRRIAEHVTRTREALEARIEEMPPEQRAHMRRRLAEMPRVDNASAIRIERLGNGTIAGIGCQEAMVHVNDEPSHEVCAASAHDLGLSPAAFHTIEEMFAFFAEMTGGMSEGNAELGPRSTRQVMRELDG